eukprot:297224-Amorphochlora_amoeboformis.AAC.1
MVMMRGTLFSLERESRMETVMGGNKLQAAKLVTFRADMIHPSHEMIVLGLLSLFATATGTEVKQNTSIEEVGNLKRCPKIRLPCSWSKKCFSFSAVKKLHYISPDNLKGPENFRNFSALREKMKSKHLRIRAARHWFGIAGFFTYPTYVINQ